MAQELTATVDRFEGNQAVLSFGDGQQVTVARALLPLGSGEGAVVRVQLAAAAEVEAARAADARRLLTDILQGGGQK